MILLSSADEVVKISCERQLLFGAVKSLISREVEAATEVRLLRHRMTRLNASRDEGLKRPREKLNLCASELE